LYNKLQNYRQNEREGVIVEENGRIQTDRRRRLILSRVLRESTRSRVEHAWSLSVRVTTGLLCSPSRTFLSKSSECAGAIAANCTGCSDARLAMAKLLNTFLPSSDRKM